jgi:hypothetical protein
MNTKNPKPLSLRVESTCFSLSLSLDSSMSEASGLHITPERHRWATCWIAAASIQFNSIQLNESYCSSPVPPNVEESNVSLFTLDYSTPSPYAFGRCFCELLIIVSVFRTLIYMLCVMQVSQSVSELLQPRQVCGNSVACMLQVPAIQHMKLGLQSPCLSSFTV